jgi:Xaa-Pro aminopeptidase
MNTSGGWIDRVRHEMHARGLDVCYAYGNEYRPGDPGWLTGYDPHIEPTAVIVGQKNVIILGSPDAQNYAVEMKKTGEFRSLIGAGIPSADYPGYNWVSLEEAFFEASGKKAENAGILSPPELLPVQERENIRSVISGDMVDLSRWMLERRYHKSEIELEMLRTAAQIATAGMEAAVKASEPGILEVQVAACADFVMKWLGADRLGFTTIVMSGSRASVNIGRATDRVIEKGDMVIIGVSARYEGLNSALGRTVVAGANPSNGQKQILEHGAHAFNLAVEKLKYQGSAREVDLASRDYLASVGFEQFYNIGHGIGWTECFEERIVSQDSDYCFLKGVAVQIDVSVKPKPYFGMDAKRVGLRIEDPFVINHEGITERLTDLPLLF